jgi:thiamine biosynthesis lipoprotein
LSIKKLTSESEPANVNKRVLIPNDMLAPPTLPADAELCELTGASMGTTWSVRLMRPSQLPAQQLQDGIARQLALVIDQMSPWESDSSISQFNRAQAASWHELPQEFFQVLDYALYIAQQSGGAYDPSIGKLVNLWGFGPLPKPTVAPGAGEIAQAKQVSGWRQLQVDRLMRRVRQPGGMSLDLSSIAKGFAVDLVARFLQEQGVTAYLVEVGGELRGQGCKSDQQPWWVELEHPARTLPQQSIPQQTTVQQTILALHGLSVATSGDYRQQWEHQGKRYSHTIDPRDGQPLQHSLASVTVLHPECMKADALATAMLVMGLPAGLAYAEQLGLPCRFISRSATGFSETMSTAMQAMLA